MVIACNLIFTDTADHPILEVLCPDALTEPFVIGARSE